MVTKKCYTSRCTRVSKYLTKTQFFLNCLVVSSRRSDMLSALLHVHVCNTRTCMPAGVALRLSEPSSTSGFCAMRRPSAGIRPEVIKMQIERRDRNLS